MAGGRSWCWHLVILALVFPTVTCDIGQLILPDDAKHKPLCMAYNPGFGPLPTEPAAVALVSPDNACSPVTNGPSLAGKVAVVARGNCSFVVKLRSVRSYNPVAVVIVNNDTDYFAPGAINASNYKEQGNVVMAMVSRSDKQTLQANTVVSFRKVTAAKFDPNISLFFVVAVGCLVAGCWWAGLEQRKTSLQSADRQDGDSSDRTVLAQSQDALEFTPRTILVFLVAASTVIVLLYLLYKYLVYAAIAIFVIAGAAGVARCLDALLAVLTGPGQQRQHVNLPLVGATPVASLVTFGCGLILAIVWVVQRHQPYAWVLQDVLGVAFLVSTTQLLPLPNLKLATLLLLAFFAYDVFFVFITPYITPHHKSIMIEAATGGGESSESIPLVVKIPRLHPSPCASGQQFSLLGFGDVLIPSLLVSLCLRFDYTVAGANLPAWHRKSVFGRYPFFIVSCVAYSVGLVATFVALGLSSMAQPALLYLVPCTLGSTVFLAYWKGLLATMWRGHRRSPNRRVQAVGDDENSEDSDDDMLVDDPSDNEGDMEHLPLMLDHDASVTDA
eukprot:m.12595 g.12595  ORF g.12595 m.12595 type:complete len:557 (-) comp4307_c0_seq1:43-1713(-)